MAIDKNFIMGYGAGKASKASQTIIEETDAWLEENISQETGYVLDRTLSMQNAAAPADLVGDLKSAISELDGEQKFVSGTSSKYINIDISAGDTFVFRNTGSGVVGIVKSQLNGTNVEEVLANLAANTDAEWTAESTADRFYIYFNSSSELVVFRKNSLRYDVYANTEQIEENKTATEVNASSVDALDAEVGNMLEDSKDSSGSRYLNYNIKAGVKYHIRTGAGILGWLKTQTANSADVEVIMQNVPANSDMMWTATYDAAKIFIYYNSASYFSIVENNSISDTVKTNQLETVRMIKDQSDFSRATSGYNYYDRQITKGHTYSICNHGPGAIGSMCTATNSNVRVEWITQTETPAGGMVVFTATDDAARLYVNYNAPSSVSIFDMGAAFSGAELAAMTSAKDYSKQATYEIGDYCIKDFRLWKATVAIETPGNWNAAHWEITDMISASKTLIDSAVLAEQIVTPDYNVDAVASDTYISEDMSVVGNELWLFTQSASVGGAQDGYISMLDKANYSTMNHQCTHNLGHCGTTDYDQDNDRMIICGADNGSADTPYMYIYHNASAWAELSAVAYADQTVDRIDLSALASAYGQVTYLAACWGPRTTNGDKMVYLYGGGRWYLLLMGIGANELDMGTYTVASAGRYNGTYKVLNYWAYETHTPWEAYDDIMQGMKMHNGIVYTSNGHRATTIREWIFKDNHVATAKQHRTPWIDNSGSHSTAQGQGLDFNNDKLIVAISSGYIATIE